MVPAMHSFVRGLIRSRRVKAAALTSGAAEEFAKSYVAGTSIEHAVAAARRLVSQGLEVSLAYLPLSDSEDETPGMLAEVLVGLAGTAQGAEVSVKPSSLGLRRDVSAARRRLDTLCAQAAAHGAHVTLEMQGTAEFGDTVDLWRDISREHASLGLTLPSDIRASEPTLARIAKEQARVRLCVGSYPVPRHLGYRDEHDKDRALVRLLRRAMADGAYAMVATHHPTVIAIAQELARREGISPLGFEFQMFYGVRPLEHRRLADIGYRARTYIPFGPAWFEYLTTRIAARPRTLFSYLRAIRDKR